LAAHDDASGVGGAGVWCLGRAVTIFVGVQGGGQRNFVTAFRGVVGEDCGGHPQWAGIVAVGQVGGDVQGCAGPGGGVGVVQVVLGESDRCRGGVGQGVVFGAGEQRGGPGAWRVLPRPAQCGDVERGEEAGVADGQGPHGGGGGSVGPLDPPGAVSGAPGRVVPADGDRCGGGVGEVFGQGTGAPGPPGHADPSLDGISLHGFAAVVGR
jgi:hypothetical protein